MKEKCNRTGFVRHGGSRIAKRLSALILSACMLTVFMPATAFAASGTVKLQIQADWDAACSSSMIPQINAFRTGSEAWYWNASNTQKVRAAGLSALRYDARLEYLAQQRAVQISVYFDHHLPDGSLPFSDFASQNGFRSAGENIAMGQKSVEKVMKDWEEANQRYAGQGHRRNMLSSKYNAVGTAHVVRGGTDYWVQEFARVSSVDSVQRNYGSTVSAAVSINSDDLSSAEVYVQPSVISLGRQGMSAELPRISVKNLWLSPYDSVDGTLIPDSGWKSSNEKVAKVQNGRVTAVSGNGTAQLTASAGGVTYTVQVKTGSSAGNGIFYDVDPTAWYEAAVDYVYKNGIMNGVGDRQFNPDGVLTRGMIVQMLYNFDGRPAVSGDSGFTDVSSGDWYERAVAWASASDIVNGYSSRAFGPDDPVTREQMAAIMLRYSRYHSYDTSARADIWSFDDSYRISEWAADSLSWAVGSRILSGIGANRLDPSGTATRAQVAQMFKNYNDNVISGAGNLHSQN